MNATTVAALRELLGREDELVDRVDHELQVIHDWTARRRGGPVELHLIRELAKDVVAAVLELTAALPSFPPPPVLSTITDDDRCPRCDSPAPNLHPAVQHEGEVTICPHPWHGDAAFPGPARVAARRDAQAAAERLPTVGHWSDDDRVDHPQPGDPAGPLPDGVQGFALPPRIRVDPDLRTAP